MRRSLVSLILAAIVVLIWPATALAATNPGLLTAGDFAVLAGTSITNTGPSWITGAIGAGAAGIAAGSFPPGTAGPQHVNDGVYTQAQTDLTNAYVWIAVLTTAGFGAIGFVDDYLKIVRRSHYGLRPVYKMGWQVAIAAHYGRPGCDPGRNALASKTLVGHSEPASGLTGVAFARRRPTPPAVAPAQT